LYSSIRSIPAEKTIELPGAFFFLDSEHKKIILKRTTYDLFESGGGGDVIFLSQFDVGVLNIGNLPKIPGYCIVDSKVNYLPSGVLYDWSYIKYEKCT